MKTRHTKTRHTKTRHTKTRHTKTRRILIASLTLFAALAAPPGASATFDPSARFLEAERVLRDGGRVASGVEAAAVLAGVTPRASTVAPAPRAHVRAVAGFLLDAIARAEVRVRAALHRAPALDLATLSELMARATVVPPDVAAGARLAQMQAAAAAAVDLPGLYGAALDLARAIDRALPVLRAVAARMAPAAAAAPCDVLDLPRVCVSGTGPNENSVDAALVIDLGGDDTHIHAAGAGTTAQPVSITIDVGGDDRYLRQAGPAQGAGNLGVGMLVDAAGDDLYSIHTLGGNVATVGQGSNHSSGAGLLADLGGNDIYRVASDTLDQTVATGQGRGTQPGFGVLLDHGGGNDTYAISARSAGPIEQPDQVKLGGINANGQGLGGLGGVGILSDDGGADAFRQEVVTATVAPEESRPVTQIPITGPQGLGGGITGGIGLLRLGDGPTTYDVLASSSAPWSAVLNANVLGWSSGGAGGLIDRGGDDRYSVSVRSHASRRTVANDGCACDAVYADATQALPNWATAGARAMGAAAGGTALLLDGAGDDEYRAEVQARADAEAVDARAEPGEGASASALANAASIYVQGVALGGSGLLRDESGDDLYEAIASSSARAFASHPGGLAEARARGEQVFAQAQGSGDASGGPGTGSLVDLDGADTYRVHVASEATADPPTSVTTRSVAPSAQGSAANESVGVLADLDHDAPDRFELTPPEAACEGTRGEGTWVDCGSGAGIGSVGSYPS